MLKKITCSLLSTGLLVAANAAFAVNVQWVNQSGDSLSEVGGFSVLEYKNAGLGGMDWSVTGGGSAGGNGASQLWLFNAPNEASVSFSTPSDAVSFMMAGDFNDGFAEFFVDQVSVGSYNLHNLGNKSLIVSGLTNAAHTISVKHLDQKDDTSSGKHVAIFGGAAVSEVPLPLSAWLFGSALAGLAGVRRCTR